MKKTINELENLYLKSYPAMKEFQEDGWAVRISDGLGSDFNCIVPVSENAEDTLLQKLIDCEEIFYSMGRKPVIKVLSNSPLKLSYLLENRGYNFISKHYTLGMNLKAYYPQPVIVHKIHNNQALTDEFIEAYISFEKRTQETADNLRILLNNIKNKVICTYYTKDDIIKATCLGVITDNVINIAFLAKDEKLQTDGLQKALLNKLLMKAQEAGTDSACIRVGSMDDEELKMYSRMGFTEVYSYSYRAKTN